MNFSNTDSSNSAQKRQEFITNVSFDNPLLKGSAETIKYFYHV